MGWMALAVTGVRRVQREGERSRDGYVEGRGGRKAGRPRLGAHLGFAAGLGAQPVGGAVELLGHHTQELGLVLTAVVVGGADVHQLEGGTQGGMTGRVGGREEGRGGCWPSSRGRLVS